MRKRNELPRRVASVALATCMAASSVPTAALAEAVDELGGAQAQVEESASDESEASETEDDTGSADATETENPGNELGGGTDSTDSEPDSSVTDAPAGDQSADAGTSAEPSQGATAGTTGQQEAQAEPATAPAPNEATDQADAAEQDTTTVSNLVSEDGYAYADNGDGTCTITGYQGGEADLAIPSTINNLTVTSIDQGAFQGHAVNTLALPSSVASIGTDAFGGCGISQVKTTSWGSYDLLAASEGSASFGENAVAFVSPETGDEHLEPGDDTGFGIISKIDGAVKNARCKIVTPSGKEIQVQLLYGNDGRWRLHVDASWCENGTVTVKGFIYEDAAGNETEVLTTGYFGAYLLNYADNGDGTCTVTGMWGQTPDLVVPSEIDGLRVTAIAEKAFQGCSWVETLSLPEGLLSVGNYAFQDCTGLRAAHLPEGLGSLGYGAFFNCASLEEASVPGPVGTLAHSAFFNCTALRSVTLGEGITSLGSSSFQSCSSLASVELPSTLTSLEDRCFYCCSSLASLELPASVAEVGEYAFKDLAQGGAVTVQTWSLYHKLAGNSTYTTPGYTTVSYAGPTTVYGTSLTLEGKIGVNMYVAIPDAIHNLEGAQASISFLGSTYTAPLASATRASFDENGVPVYVFTQDIFAKNMADEVTFQILDAQGNALPLVNRADTAFGTSYTCSAKSYYEATQSTGVSNEKLAALATAMVNYGAASQRYFGYNTDNFAGNPNSAQATLVSESDLAPYKSAGFSGKVDGLKYVGSTLTLEETTTVSHYFELGLGRSISDYTFTVNGQVVTPVRSGTYWKVTAANVPAQNLGDAHTLTVSRGNQTGTLSYCALSYAYSVLTRQPGSDLATLCRNLYVYNQAANAYFGSRS